MARALKRTYGDARAVCQELDLNPQNNGGHIL